MVKKCCPPQNNYSSSFEDILNERKFRNYCLKKEKQCCTPQMKQEQIHEVLKNEMEQLEKLPDDSKKKRLIKVLEWLND